MNLPISSRRWVRLQEFRQVGEEVTGGAAGDVCILHRVYAVIVQLLAHDPVPVGLARMLGVEVDPLRWQRKSLLCFR